MYTFLCSRTIVSVMVPAREGVMLVKDSSKPERSIL
jgi:hypothetical protein